MEETRSSTVNDYFVEKSRMEDEIDSIVDEIEELKEQRDNKIEEYEAFCEDFLRRNSLQIKTWEEEE